MYINTYNPMHKYNGLRRNRIPNSPQCQDWVSGDPFKRGLVGHWKSIGDVSALGTWYDISGNDNNGTLTGNTYIDNSGANFDGVTGTGITLPTLSVDIKNDTSGTIVMWAKAIEADVRIFNYTLTTSFDKHMLLYIRSSSRLAFIWRYNTGTYGNDYVLVEGDTPISFGTYYHLAVTTDGSAYKLYVNGNEQSLSISGNDLGRWFGDMPTESYSSYLGRYRRLGTDFSYKGTLNDTRIYNRSLSESEIKLLYNQTKGYYN